MMSSNFLLSLVILSLFCYETILSSTRDQMIVANLKAKLSKARTWKQALAIFADSNVNNRHQVAMQTDLRKLEREIQKQASNDDGVSSNKTIPYVNGGCLPRVTCIPVHTQQVSAGGVVFPTCVEVHRCSGCCQEGQFSCEATKFDYVYFSPIVKFQYTEEAADPITVLPSFRTENHTECTCKCNLGDNACPSNAQVLDRELCRCREQACFPQCPAMQRCQLLENHDKPTCVCKRPIPDQNGAYSCPIGYQPDARCKTCRRYPY